jgi:hypothetical protein
LKSIAEKDTTGAPKFAAIAISDMTNNLKPPARKIILKINRKKDICHVIIRKNWREKNAFFLHYISYVSMFFS